MTIAPLPDFPDGNLCHGFEPQGHVLDSMELKRRLTAHLDATERQIKAQPLVIGLGGWKEHGKDATADHLAAQHDFLKLGMSDTLGEALARLKSLRVSLHNAPADILERLGHNSAHKGRRVYLRYAYVLNAIGYTEAKRIPNVRILLQELGTEVGRELLGEDTWIGPVKNKISALTAEGHSVAVTGIRFANELAAIRDLGGITVWVHRPAKAEPADSHASENSLRPEDFDYIMRVPEGLEHVASLTDEWLPAWKDESARRSRVRDLMTRPSVFDHQNETPVTTTLNAPRVITTISNTSEPKTWPHYDH